MKRKVVLLYAAYACLVAGLSIWQYKSYKDSFEVIVPYSHPYDGAYETTHITQESTEIITESTETSAPIQKSVPETTPKTETTSEIETTAATDPTEAIHYPLNLNTATIEELCTLPGIGEVTAQAICNYREQIGGFTYMAQLMEVYGIGEGKYQQILSYLYLEQEFPPTIETEPEPISPQSLIEPETVPTSIPVLNLNTVTKEELLLLPGCTEEIAENILYLRDVLIHIFYNPLEITMAEGVTDELFFQWQPYLAVDDEGGTQLPLDITD